MSVLEQFHIRQQALALLTCVACLFAASCARDVEVVTAPPQKPDIIDFIELDWQAPQSCPQRDAVLRTIEQMLANATDASYETVTIQAAVQEQPGEFSLDLRTQQRGKIGRRQMRDASCRALSQAGAFVIALMLDPKAKMIETLAEQEPPVLAEPATVEPTWDNRRWYLGLGPMLQYVNSPDTAAGTVLYAGRRWKIWHLELHGLVTFPRISEAFAGGTKSRFFNWALGVRGLTLFPFGRWSLGPFLGVNLGGFKAKTRGLDPPAQAQTTWWELDAGARTSVQLKKGWALAAQGNIGALLNRPSFTVAGVGEGKFSTRWFLRFGLFVELHFFGK